MKIVANQTFKHGTETYEEGQEYEVDDELAEYFESVGFTGERIAGRDVTLDIQDVYEGQKAEVN